MSWWDDHKLDKSCLHLTLVFDSCKTKQIYLVRDHRIMTLDSNQNLIFRLDTSASKRCCCICIKIITQRVRCECSDWLTCWPVRCILRRQIDSDAASQSLNASLMVHLVFSFTWREVNFMLLVTDDQSSVSFQTKKIIALHVWLLQDLQPRQICGFG